MSKGLGACVTAIAMLLLVALPVCAQASEDTSLKSELLRLAQDWEHVKLQVIDRGDQERKMAVLALRAGKIAEQYENIPDPIVWVGIITSEEASMANENGSPLKAFELAKRARDVLEMVEKPDPMTMDAAAPATLGLLYDRVPGFPMGFGDKVKARLYLQEAVRYAPDGLDANFFYGDFLYKHGEQCEALKVLERALTLPELSNRQLWDKSLRAAIRRILSEMPNAVLHRTECEANILR